MYIEHNGNYFWINKAPSCFISRNGKQDICVYKRSLWGRRQPDGKWYKCCLRLAAEDGALLRYYGAVPPHITVEWLRQMGFIDA